jgi:hypothetical protein
LLYVPISSFVACFLAALDLYRRYYR